MILLAKKKVLKKISCFFFENESNFDHKGFFGNEFSLTFEPMVHYKEMKMFLFL